MTAVGAIDFTYRYPFASELSRSGQGLGLRLATCGASQKHPHYFDGRLLEPRIAADMLLVLSQVVRTHFFLSRPRLLDPVLTSSESMLRFEAFSGCCGVYARVDLTAEAFDAEIRRPGTTNVDFNDPMRAALTRVHDDDQVRLSVGGGRSDVTARRGVGGREEGEAAGPVDQRI